MNVMQGCLRLLVQHFLDGGIGPKFTASFA